MSIIRVMLFRYSATRDVARGGFRRFATIIGVFFREINFFRGNLAWLLFLNVWFEPRPTNSNIADAKG